MANPGSATEPGAAPFPGLGLGALNVGNLLDTVEFVKNAWSSFGVPSALAPTVDVDELDRRIADLKAVEQWLAMNLGLLKASVQALEIQRGTLATLQAYGSMLGAQAQGLPGGDTLARAMAAVASSAMSTAPASEPVSGGASIPAATMPNDAAQTPQTPVAELSAAASGETPPRTVPEAPGLDAAAWWDLLHRQFSQIAAAALGASGAGSAGSAAAAGGARGSDAPTPAVGKRARREGAPVARSRQTPSAAKTRKTPAAAGSEPGRRGRGPAR